MAKRHLAEHMEQWISEQQKSALSVRDFCDRVGVSQNAFYPVAKKAGQAVTSEGKWASDESTCICFQGHGEHFGRAFRCFGTVAGPPDRSRLEPEFASLPLPGFQFLRNTIARARVHFVGVCRLNAEWVRCRLCCLTQRHP